MKSLTTRVLSALVALVGIIALYYFFQDFGFKILVSIAVLLGGYEILHILFSDRDPLVLKSLFYLFNLFVFAVASIYPIHGALALGLAFVLFSILVLITNTRYKDIQEVRDFLSKSFLGFIYVGILPSFAWRLLDLPHGIWWFLVLLCVVFAGDIGAYIFGTLWGKTKIMPRISPKKSFQGSVGGLIGSAAAAAVSYSFFPYVSCQYLVILALIAGFAGQLGDFFESLLKRIADVKDSGNIMPGHGGVLDRIDGVIFASPVIFFGALILEKIL